MTGLASVKQIVRSAALGLTVCALTLSVLAVNPQKASADACSINGRNCYFGYFFNGYDGGPGVLQRNVLTAPALLNVHNANQFIVEMNARLSGCSPNGVLPNPNDQNQTGAAFIILTMLGAPPGTPKNVACQRFAEWSSIVQLYASSGLVNFNQVYNFGGINTRSSGPDVAYYPDAGAAPSIVFYSPANGLPIYAIKKDCGNPVGRLQALTLNYNLQPSISVTANGAPVTGAVEPGDNLLFTYRITNTANMDSPVVNCTARAINHPGYFPTPATPEGGGSNVATFCPRSFPQSSTTVVSNEAVNNVPANTTLCRTLFVSPPGPGGGSRGTELCVAVASKPYLRVSSGDVKFGGDFETAPDVCGSNPDAGAVSWNKRDAGLYSGAGTQHAAYALSMLNDFASAQGSPAGGAARGVGLSFANTSTNPAGGDFGGDFGTVKCIKDYYSQKPATTSLIPSNVSSMVTGAYAANGNVTLSGGNVNPDQRSTVYIDGDLFITSNITYVGSWAYNRIPLFQVVVRGNIYVGNNVTRLDGTYIAQPSNANNGYIHTCATDPVPPFSPANITTGSFYGSCTNKLTVNGSFVSRNAEFMRTGGTVKQSNTGDFSAELFNYGPAFWISQPASNTTNDGRVDNYDAITSLPPVL